MHSQVKDTEKEHNARKKRRHEKRLKKLKSIVLNKSDKEDLKLSRNRTHAKAKHIIGTNTTGRFKNYDFGDIDITDIVKNTNEVNDLERSKRYRQVVKNEKKKYRSR